MFTCGACGQASAPKEISRSWISAKRKRLYALLDKYGKRVGVSVGWEIVKETRLCVGCHEDAVKADEYRNQEDRPEPSGGKSTVS